ncbi:MAG: hypothetical protein HKN09_13195 [Saprospiraceae bacterium]|nr:hypothetical protein [Saprospiraceae bacterium]
MKHSISRISTLVFILSCTTLFTIASQDENVEMNSVGTNLPSKYNKSDTVPLVQYIQKDKAFKKRDKQKPAFFINDVLVKENTISTINPDQIESVKVIKDSLTMRDKNHNGEVYITMKKAYSPQFISLSALKRKYVDEKYKSSLFMIDNKVIDDDYDSYMIDEKYIMKIEVEFIQNEKERLGINIIHLITRSEQNIKKENEILIRGSMY